MDLKGRHFLTLKDYTKEEINQLFILMMKLYPGINNLKEKIANDK